MGRITALLVSGFAAIAMSVAGLTVMSGVAQAASPTTLWVNSGATVTGNGISCGAPGFNAIQDAVNAAPAGSTIQVCAGTYAEQLQITRSVTIVGRGNVFVTLPQTIVNSTTPCDTAPGTGSFQPDQDGIAICGNATVALNNIVVNAAWPTSTCNDSLYGILVGGGATLAFTNSAVTAAGAFPLNGCQGGVGIQVGMAWTTPVEVGHLTLADSSVSGYQKNGITIDGWQSTASIDHATVAGAGPTPSIAQNGIQVSNSGKASITDSRIIGNECSDNAAPCGSNGLTQTQSAGVLFFGAAVGSTLTGSSISNNDMGVYYSANPSGRVITKPAVTISGDTFSDDRYEGVVLDQGAANVTHTTIEHGNVGVEVLQYAGSNSQTFGAKSVASFIAFSKIHVATVDVLSDKAAGDKAGTFTISSSNIHASKVKDNSTNLPVIEKSDH